MQSLLDFFANFGDAFSSLLDFLATMVGELVDVGLLLGTAVSQISQMLAFLPLSVHTLLYLFVVIAVMYKFLGREG